MKFLNDMYCIIVKNNNDIEDEFEKYCSTFLKSSDSKYILGGDDDDISIYLTYLDNDKINKIVDFFKKHNMLIKHNKIDNIVSLICSDEKYLTLYSDEHNKPILDEYIKYHISVDDILDRMINEKISVTDLLPIELKILNG